MKRSNVRSLAGLSVIWLFTLAGCQQKRDLTQLEGFVKDPSAGVILISEKQAKHMKHAFDKWFRNPGMYNKNGTGKQVGPILPYPADDYDVPLGDSCDDPSCGTPIKSNDAVSRAVWVSKDVINYLDHLLQDSSLCDGARIYFAAEDTMAEGPYQHFQHQTTVYIVPTIPSNSDDTNRLHTDVFHYIHSNFTADSLKNSSRHPGFTVGKYGSYVLDGNALNHGELCPDQCDPTVIEPLALKKAH